MEDQMVVRLNAFPMPALGILWVVHAFTETIMLQYENIIASATISIRHDMSTLIQRNKIKKLFSSLLCFIAFLFLFQKYEIEKNIFFIFILFCFFATFSFMSVM